MADLIRASCGNSVHRLLEYTPNGGGFNFCALNDGDPLIDAIIIDEASDAGYYAYLSSAESGSGRLSAGFTGDADQLPPSVGAGS